MNWPRIAALTLCAPLCAQFPAEALKPGLGSFTFQDPKVNLGRPLRVWYRVPEVIKADTPVLMVMHGVRRDGERYRDDWAGVAGRHAAVLLCPEFSLADFPSDSQYNFGNVYPGPAEDGLLPEPRPEAEWSYSCLDPIFEAVVARLKLQTQGYLLYGHSAGSQFVHRMAFFKPGAKAKQIVSANAGWYMFPDPAIRFPYGLGGTPCDPARVRQALALPMTILLGDQDIDPGHKDLRRTPGAMRQGRFRLERGKAYFAAAREQAERLKTPFNWKLVLAPGVAHSDKNMAPFAEKVLFPERP
jgi:hypothetical protein